MNPVTKTDDQVISLTDSTKFLKLFLKISKIDEHLNWTDHVKTAFSKASSSGLYALPKMSLICSPPTLKSIYFANIRYIISFGIWSLQGYFKTKLGFKTKDFKKKKKAKRMMLQLG